MTELATCHTSLSFSPLTNTETSSLRCRAEVTADGVDNCNLSNFNEGCKELDAQGNQEGPFVGLEDAAQEALYTDPAITHVGIGAAECGGAWYWSVLAGTERRSSVGGWMDRWGT